jgi:hypothetical protein
MKNRPRHISRGRFFYPQSAIFENRRAARWLAGLSFGSRLATALAQQTIIRV